MFLRDVFIDSISETGLKVSPRLQHVWSVSSENNLHLQILKYAMSLICLKVNTSNVYFKVMFIKMLKRFYLTKT